MHADYRAEGDLNMKNSLLKRTLRKLGIIRAYSSILERRQKRRNQADRWYFHLLPIKKNKLVFCNFFGRGYGDNPKSLSEEIIRQGLPWDLVWLTAKEEQLPPQIRQVRYGSPEAMRELATAKLWVFNIRNIKHPHKRRSQKYLQTWHGGGIALKKHEGMAEEKLSPNYVQAAKADGAICDYILSSDAIRSEVQRLYYWLNPNTLILEYGTPRDDVFFDPDQQSYYKKTIREAYNIDDSARIVLYMPTFRDDGDTSCYNLDYQRVIDTFESKLKRKVFLFVRLHPNVPIDSVSFPVHPQIINVTSYPEAYELFLASDYAISDYNSSAICKMPLLRKPSFIFASDFEAYSRTRGLTKYYYELPIPISTTNDQLIEQIQQFDSSSYFEKWDQYYTKHPSFETGNASRQIVDFIKKNVIRLEK